MKDLKADWRRWIPAERIAAVCIALGMTSGSQRCFFSRLVPSVDDGLINLVSPLGWLIEAIGVER